MKDSLKQFYMTIAEMYALRSKDPKVKVGCAIITQEGIIYPGYNGDEIGGSNQRDSTGNGDSGFVHAEINALVKFNPTIHKDCSAFVTVIPCRVCARTIINSKSITHVYYKNTYRDMSGLDILERSGIIVEQVI